MLSEILALSFFVVFLYLSVDFMFWLASLKEISDEEDYGEW